MDDFKPGQNPFATQSDIPAGVNPFAPASGSTPAIPAENSLWDETKRQGLLTVRHLLNAAASPAVLLDKAQAKASDAISGKHIGGTLGEDLNARLTSLGLPTADRPVERFTQNVAESAPAFALPAAFIPQAAGNAGIAAAQAQPGQEGTQALWSGALGGGAHALTRAVGGIVRPTADAKTLMDAGVALTPGQAAGAGSRMARFEQSMASNPVASVAVRNAQRRAVEEANVAAAQSVASLVDEKVKLGLPPREAIERTREVISKTYDDALSGIKADPMQVLRNLESNYEGLIANNPMTTREGFMHMQQSMGERLKYLADQGGTLDGPMLKQIDSEVGTHIRRLQKSPNAMDKANAGIWMDLQQALRDDMARLAPTVEQANKLNAANGAYRQLLALEKALGTESVATPRRLRQALAKAEIKDAGINRISSAMDATLQNTLPDSGTAERLIANALPSLLFGGGALGTGLGYDTLGMGMMAAGALGSRPGARFMTGQMAGQQALASALRRTTPHTTAVIREDGKND